MELFQDISNQSLASKQQQPAVHKTFERRRRVAAIPEESPALSDGDDDGDDASSCGSPTSTTCPQSCASSAAAPPTAPGTLSKRGRRSSVLRGAALPGHQLFSSQVQASRSLLLAKMSKARRKAYLAYTQQMAEYFAEVDQFELVVESPTAAAADDKARSRRTPAAATPAAAACTPQQQPADPGTGTPPPASALRSATPASAAPSSGSLAASQQAAESCLKASPPDLSAAAGARAASPPHSPAASSASLAGAAGAEDAGLYAVTPHRGMLPAHNSSSSMTGLSLAASTPAGQDLPSPAAAGSAAAAGVDGAAADSQQLRTDTASPPPCEQQAAASARSARLQHASSSTHAGVSSSRSGRSSLAAVTPAVAGSATQQDSSGLSASLASSTPAAAAAAATQQADMQQLLQQMQDMLLAVTPSAGHSHNAQVMPEQQQQQQQQQRAQEEELQAAGAVEGAPAASKPAGKQQQQHAQKGKQQKQKPARKKTQTGKEPAADIAADEADGAGADGAHAAEVQRQAQQQQQLAEQHYQAWLQQQAGAAAAAELQALELEASADAALTPLQQMLKACGQSVSLADIPAMCDFLADVVDLRDVVKIGEGTYGEAFKSGQVVLKFVPMEGPNLINGWPQKGAGDLLGEAVIALALTDLAQERDESGALHASYTDAFVQTHRVGVCRGPYPAPFIKAWRAWDKRHKSENDAIAGLPEEQLYAVFAMANCGRDLEGYVLQGYEQVRSLMLQTALALAVAEEALAFEHRDLHWGNIMLSPPQATHVTARLKGCNIRVRAEGARVRLIDFTASRLQTPGGDVVFCDLEAEDGIFDGAKGHPQFETYRRMRKLTRKDWTGSHPGTNVLWLQYLTELLLSAEKPIPGASAAQKRSLREFKKRLGGYSSCSEVIWDALFEGLWATV